MSRRLTVNSLALMASTAATGLAGFVFWTIAARSASALTIGNAASLVSAVTFIGSLASLNFINVFARFLPDAGSRRTRLWVRGCQAVLVSGLMATVAFLATPLAPPSVTAHITAEAGFVALVMGFSVFLIQDGALIGLDRTTLVPLENVLVAGLRIALLPLALVMNPLLALMLAWGVPTMFAVVVINIMVGLRFLPHEQLKSSKSRLPPRRELVRFIGIESVTTAVSSAVTAFLPVLVAHRFGSEVTGYFYIPWLIGTSVWTLISNVLLAFVREAVRDPAAAATALRRAMVLCVGLCALAALLAAGFPRVILFLVGREFSSQGAMVLRWIGLSIPAFGCHILYWSLCLLRRRPVPLLLMNTLNTFGVLSVVLIKSHDLNSIGSGYCFVQYLVATVIAVPLIHEYRRLRSSSQHQDSSRDVMSPLPALLPNEDS